jgi:hypothetical protein
VIATNANPVMNHHQNPYLLSNEESGLSSSLSTSHTGAAQQLLSNMRRREETAASQEPRVFYDNGEESPIWTEDSAESRESSLELHPEPNQGQDIPEYLKAEYGYLEQTKEYRNAFIAVPKGIKLNKDKNILPSLCNGSLNENGTGIYLKFEVPSGSWRKADRVYYYELICGNDLDRNFDDVLQKISTGEITESYIGKVKDSKKKDVCTYQYMDQTSVHSGIPWAYKVIWSQEALIKPHEDAMRKAWEAKQAETLNQKAAIGPSQSSQSRSRAQGWVMQHFRNLSRHPKSSADREPRARGVRI